MTSHISLLWSCLFLFGAVSCTVSIRDLWKRKENPSASFQLPWTMAVALLTLVCLRRARHPLPSQAENSQEMIFATALIAALWWGLIARWINLLRRKH